MSQEKERAALGREAAHAKPETLERNNSSKQIPASSMPPWRPRWRPLSELTGLLDLAAAHYTNLQPLWAVENIVKSGRVAA